MSVQLRFTVVAGVLSDHDLLEILLCQRETMMSAYTLLWIANIVLLGSQSFLCYAYIRVDTSIRMQLYATDILLPKMPTPHEGVGVLPCDLDLLKRRTEEDYWSSIPWLGCHKQLTFLHIWLVDLLANIARQKERTLIIYAGYVNLSLIVRRPSVKTWCIMGQCYFCRSWIDCKFWIWQWILLEVFAITHPKFRSIKGPNADPLTHQVLFSSGFLLLEFFSCSALEWSCSNCC